MQSFSSNSVQFRYWSYIYETISTPDPHKKRSKFVVVRLKSNPSPVLTIGPERNIRDRDQCWPESHFQTPRVLLHSCFKIFESGLGPVSSEISDLLLFLSYFTPQNKQTKLGNYFLCVFCKQNNLVRCQLPRKSYSMVITLNIENFWT